MVLEGYLVVSTLLFAIGSFGFMARRNAILMLISIELMFNAANLEHIGKVEDLGYDSVWASEHILFYGPTLEGMTTLAFFAARVPARGYQSLKTVGRTNLRYHFAVGALELERPALGALVPEVRNPAPASAHQRLWQQRATRVLGLGAVQIYVCKPPAGLSQLDTDV